MNNSTLKKLLIEYDKKKSTEERQADLKKRELYQREPSLEEIDKQLSILAISTTKSLINHNDPTLLKNLQNQIDDLKNKKIAIFKDLNINPDDLLPNYECNLCKDTGYVTNSDYTSSMCSCLKQKLFDMEYNKSNIYNLKSQTFENFSSFLYSDEVNVEKYKANISVQVNSNKNKNKYILNACESFKVYNNKYLFNLRKDIY